ncbi:unnamed protein product (macronuclear) [Paramecium tetraurelia]|uniref:Uncharacterized protein n=1 Tax=Paramecium tetraurelia TaxID=5888 RepID=A0EBB9_PARTE|nr:uncharacterized protein GSPATT00025320001 [Paramecium tetraurelia]CAK92586.1 unnamed protein product [Paramecium tetraurelia]|eukprot:XP_001459983.1 hypothetical protein (macronuclear) [Paramecium tetraurelia strain d4-2]
MPSPERKKNKHKKKDKDSSHRSSPKHKSKKKKSSRTPSRGREKKKDYKKEIKESPHNTQTLSDKQLTDMFGSLPGFNLEILKKIQEQMKDGRRPSNDDQQQLMGLSAYGFLPIVNQQIPIVLPTPGTKKSSRQQKNMKNTFKQRMLVPFTYDTLMVILEDQFYQDQLPEELITQIKRRIIDLIKKRVQDQKQEEFNEKIEKLEQDLKKPMILDEQQQQQQQQQQLNLIKSIFTVLQNNKEDGHQQSQLSTDIKDLLQPMEIETPNIVEKDLYEEAKLLFR